MQIKMHKQKLLNIELKIWEDIQKNKQSNETDYAASIRLIKKGLQNEVK